jgi:hypothetical protein
VIAWSVDARNICNPLRFAHRASIKALDAEEKPREETTMLDKVVTKLAASALAVAVQAISNADLACAIGESE